MASRLTRVDRSALPSVSETPLDHQALVVDHVSIAAGWEATWACWKSPLESGWCKDISLSKLDCMPIGIYREAGTLPKDPIGVPVCMEKMHGTSVMAL